MKIIINTYVKQLQNQLSNQLNKTLSDDKNPFLLFLSGGSVLKMLDEVKPDFLNSKITLTMLDERFSNEPSINNYLQLVNTTFFRSALQANCPVLDTIPTQNEKLEDFTDRYLEGITNWLRKNPKGKFVAIMGVGPDGHTAGIMPYPDEEDKFNYLFNNPKKLVVGYQVNKIEEMYKYNERITITLAFMRKYMDQAIVYAVGDEKKNALERIVKQDKLSQTPASIINEIEESYLFTDQDLTS